MVFWFNITLSKTTFISRNQNIIMVVGELIGLGKDMLAQIMQLDTVLIFVILVIAAVIGYKILKYLMKAFIVGIVFGGIPIFMTFMGYPMDISFASISGWAVTGIVVFLVYHTISTTIKATKFILSPFGSKKKEKVVVKEKIVHVPAEKKKNRK